jgi:hypothetical protein
MVPARLPRAAAGAPRAAARQAAREEAPA